MSDTKLTQAQQSTVEEIKTKQSVDRYFAKRQVALAWLGDRYLLATPINRRK